MTHIEKIEADELELLKKVAGVERHIFSTLEKANIVSRDLKGVESVASIETHLQEFEKEMKSHGLSYSKLCFAWEAKQAEIKAFGKIVMGDPNEVRVLSIPPSSRDKHLLQGQELTRDLDTATRDSKLAAKTALKKLKASEKVCSHEKDMLRYRN
jgi:hypothetical protein